jgi:hypothetical protein
LLSRFSFLLVLSKLAERAHVRASGSTATSAPACLLRLKQPAFGYKKIAEIHLATVYRDRPGGFFQAAGNNLTIDSQRGGCVLYPGWRGQ